MFIMVTSFHIIRLSSTVHIYIDVIYISSFINIYINVSNDKKFYNIKRRKWCNYDELM